MDELKTIAVGDGPERYLLVRDADGTERVVWFDEYNPGSVVAIAERASSCVELPDRQVKR